MFVIAFSSFSNFGILTRQRTQVLPLVLVLLVLPRENRRAPEEAPTLEGRAPARPLADPARALVLGPVARTRNHARMEGASCVAAQGRAASLAARKAVGVRMANVIDAEWGAASRHVGVTAR